MRARPCLLVSLSTFLLSGAGCVSTRPLSPAEARALGERTWRADTGEVFDATWLTLSDDGFVVQGDRVAGTLVARKGARTWDVDVAALGDRQRVQLAPREETSHLALVELLDVLEAGTAKLLRAWHQLPEWAYDGRKNLLRLGSFWVAPPPSWELMDLDVSRLHVVVQQRRARVTPNATLLVQVQRRGTDESWSEPLKRAAGLTLGARQRVKLPEEASATEDGQGTHGALVVLDGTLPREVVWHARRVVLGPLEVELLMVCGKAAARECRAAWGDLAGSLPPAVR